MDDKPSSPQAVPSIGLKWVLAALEEEGLASHTPIEILIRVRGKDDRTLRIELDNSGEIRDILRLTLGVAGK